MSDYYNAFEISPVPTPGPDAVPPEPFHGIYGMPAFVTIPTSDLAASVDFWVRGLGFFELFSSPGAIVHLRRWAFQDVLLVPAPGVQAPGAPEPGSPAPGAPEQTPAISFSFACVLSEIDSVVEACRALRPDSVDGPRDTFWNTRDVTVITPENARIVFTAAKPYDPASQEARNLESIGITAPDVGGDTQGQQLRPL
ncbi:VOC family protein [Streptomyces sp. NPDC006516]|uniref:VOC family protein n=1 Tax=Streptomyces sp. NPDC006516 TaxID=3154309 RepID=UPI0033B469EE